MEGELTIVVVCNLDSFLIGLEGENRERGREHLLLVNPHLVGDSTQQPRLNDVSLLLTLFLSSDDFRPFTQGILDDLLRALC